MSTGTFEYIRYMRDGSVKKKTAVIRSRNPNTDTYVRRRSEQNPVKIINLASRKLEEVTE
jgi:hypothetical protein